LSTRTGTVVEVHGMKATVLHHDTGDRERCRPLRDRTQLAVGDRVQTDERGGAREVVALEARERSLWRPAERGRRIMASQVDRVVIVAAVQPGPSAGLIDRFLVATDAEEIDVAIVLNKDDLDGVEAARAVLQPYADLGVQVIETSSHAHRGLDAVSDLTGSGMSVFAGHSGVGKSSLLNVLFPGIELATADVNTQTSKGRHTTSVTTCHTAGDPWPGGAMVVDTPGVRAFGLYGFELSQIGHGFREFRPYADACHFRNCLHETEPGCAVRHAVEEGAIHKGRYESYLGIVGSVRRGEG
jgi:ribosome biogenesis GTPase